MKKNGGQREKERVKNLGEFTSRPIAMTQGIRRRSLNWILTRGWWRLDLHVFAHDALLDRFVLALAGQHGRGFVRSKARTLD